MYLIRLLSSGTNTSSYYQVMNHALKKISGQYTMLHYPYFRREGESFFESQVNLTEFCLSQLSEIKNKKVLEIGCGNGVQAMYIAEKYQPSIIYAIDLNEKNIEIARKEYSDRDCSLVHFLVDDAQKLKSFENNSIDIVINIESAFHYPDKKLFLSEVFRVLKPEGEFLIADILTTNSSTSAFKKFWKGKMHLNHWQLSEYLDNFEKTGFTLRRKTDITPEVIRGFRNYAYWMKNRGKSGFFSDLAFRIFYWINIRLNIYLLKKYRYYFVFSGTKI